MSGFNKSDGEIGGGGTQGFNQTGGSTGAYPNQPIEEVFYGLRKRAGQIPSNEKYTTVTGTIDPVLDMIQRARAKHVQVSKSIVNNAWETAKNVGSMLDDWEKWV